MKRFFFLAVCLFVAGNQLCSAQFAGGSTKSYRSPRTENRTQGEYTSGYKGFFETGFSAGSNGDYGYGNASFYTTHGYQFAPYVFVGAGLGYEVGGEYMYLPIFAECRVNLNNPNKRKCTPYLGTRIGYAALDDAGSAYFNFFMGLRISLRKNALHLNMGYQLVGLEYYDGWDYYYYYTRYNHNFSFRIGYEF